ncbi:DNA primase [Acidaminobacterium chupaoyuni]
MALPESFLDELVARCDIYDIVSRYVSLKKSGSNYFGVCPFHSEKTPSFSVNREKQIYHCFGCGAGGGVINFIMRIENFTFIEAVRFLAEIAGMEMPEENFGEASARRRRQRLVELSTEAARFYAAQLQQPQGAKGLEYLRKRGMTVGTIRHFGLGFAPDGWDHLIKAMAEKGFTKEELLAAGLVVKNQSGGVYDRFRNRVMFPIIDIKGNVIAFGGRVMDDSLPKYLNSSDTPIFNKSRNLFAMNFAKRTKRDYFILAEGYMDVIALHQAGFDCAVASLGTSLTEDQARLMASRGKTEAVICYDSDEAGKKAAQRAIDILNRAGMKVRVLRVTGAKDPDEFIKKNGADGFEKLLTQTNTDIEYKLLVLKSKYDLETDEGKVGYLQAAARLLAAIPSEVQREISGRSVAREAGVSHQAMMDEIRRTLRMNRKRDKKQEEQSAKNTVRGYQPAQKELRYENLRSARCEEKLLGLVFSDEELLKKAAETIAPEEFSSPFLAKVYAGVLQRRQQGGEISLAACLTDLTQDESDLLTKIASQSVRSENPGQELEDYISVIKFEYIKKQNEDEQDLLQAAVRRRQQEHRGGM